MLFVAVGMALKYFSIIILFNITWPAVLYAQQLQLQGGQAFCLSAQDAGKRSYYFQEVKTETASTELIVRISAIFKKCLWEEGWKDWRFSIPEENEFFIIEKWPAYPPEEPFVNPQRDFYFAPFKVNGVVSTSEIRIPLKDIHDLKNYKLLVAQKNQFNEWVRAFGYYNLMPDQTAQSGLPWEISLDGRASNCRNFFDRQKFTSFMYWGPELKVSGENLELSIYAQFYNCTKSNDQYFWKAVYPSPTWRFAIHESHGFFKFLGVGGFHERVPFQHVRAHTSPWVTASMSLPLKKILSSKEYKKYEKGETIRKKIKLHWDGPDYQQNYNSTPVLNHPDRALSYKSYSDNFRLTFLLKKTAPVQAFIQVF